MKKELVKSAKTLEEAIEQACKELMVDRDKVSIEVLEIPKKGFLGIGQVEAKVKVITDVDDFNKLEVAKDYLYNLLDNMGLENFDIDVNEKSDKKVVFTLRGDNLGLAIGKRGDTLNAIQKLCSIAANRCGGDYYNVIIDVGNYREGREQALKDLALKISKSVIKSGKKITLEPMSSYERKIIHESIYNIEGVISQSRGEEPYRYIVVLPKYSLLRQRSYNMNYYNKFRNNIK